MSDEIVLGPCADTVAASEETSGGCGSAIDENVRRVIDAGEVVSLRSALLNEATERRRAECLANIQTEITKYTLDLLVREPDLDGFFRALLKTLAEEAESHVAGVWLLNEDQQCCEFWMAHFGGSVVTTKNLAEFSATQKALAQAQHLFDYKPGWVSTIEYRSDDPRVPDAVREFNAAKTEKLSTVVAPMMVAGKNLGWITICVPEGPDSGAWWRMAAFTVADLQQVKVRFSVPDTALDLFHTGRLLPVSVDAYPNERFEGRVLSVAPAADPKSRSFEIIVAIDNPTLTLRSGMIASIEVRNDATEHRQVRIPIDALVHDPTRDRYVVYAVAPTDKGTATVKAIEVRPGPLVGNQVSILDGLSAGQRIVASGANMLQPGDVVKELQ